MTTTIAEGPVVLIGYEYRLQLQAEASLFPVEATFAGQLRATPGSGTVLATISTGNGGVLRIDNRTLEIVLTEGVTSSLSQGSVVLDLVRTDLNPDRHLGVVLEIPVSLPVTRGL